jgi:hypothetical protein
VRVETCGDENQVRAEFSADFFERGIEHTPLFDGACLSRTGNSRSCPNLCRVLFAARACARIPRILMHRKKKRSIVEENSLRAVAVMHVPINDGDALDLLYSLCA